MYLEPTSRHTIPIHPAAIDGWDTSKLCVDVHEFSGVNSNRKVAFLFSHSAGFNKEVLHPMMRRLKDQLRSLRNYDQTDFTFVSWDSRFHGDSARLNEKYLVENYHSSDNAMDTKQVIDQFRLNTPKYDQFIGVGHSFGIISMLLCEYYFPNTFDGLCAIEPILTSEFHPAELKLKSPAMSSRSRPDEWKDTQECRQDLLSKKFYQNFHPEVFDQYVNYGLYKTESGTMKLKCPKQMEYIIMGYSNYDTYILYRFVESIAIPVQFVLGSDSFFMNPGLNGCLLETTNTSMLTTDILKGTHNLPNEDPDAVVAYIIKLIKRMDKKLGTIKAKL